MLQRARRVCAPPLNQPTRCDELLHWLTPTCASSHAAWQRAAQGAAAASAPQRRAPPARAAAAAAAAMAIAGFYWVTFGAFALPAALLEFGHGSGLFGGAGGGKGGAAAAGGGRQGRDYVRFRNNYLAVFALMMGERGRPACSGKGGMSHARRRRASAGCHGASPASEQALSSLVAPEHTAPHAPPPPRRPQPATGSRAPTSTTCTSTTASACGTLAASSSWALPAARSLARWRARWPTSSESRARPRGGLPEQQGVWTWGLP